MLFARAAIVFPLSGIDRSGETSSPRRSEQERLTVKVDEHVEFV